MSRRGQSTLETALGLLVVVPIVLGLIAFSELGFASLKVKEAGYAALWDVPAHRTHDLLQTPSPTSPRREWNLLRQDGTLASRSTSFSQRYGTLRGFGADVGSPNVTLDVDRVQVRCAEERGERSRFMPRADQLYSTEPLYREAGSVVQCRVDASVRIGGVPDFTIGLFGEPLLKTRAFTLCGSGSMAGGSCTKGPPLLTDTWAFTDRRENLSCLVERCDNPAVHETATAVLGGRRPFPGGGDAAALAQQMGAAVPTPFPFTTFAGSENEFLDGAPIAHGDSQWAPTPFSNDGYQQSYAARFPGYPAVDIRSSTAGLSP